ncbi:MAG: type IV pilus secretin PilQ [Deferribacteres bacterium]|nr:type IV pilus secretin PilQ [Deferribacteres bacterium]
MIYNVPALDAQPEEPPSLKSEITGIEVTDIDGTTEIKIDSTSSFKYTIYKQSDPYQIVVELQDTSLGKFTEKMVIDDAGVREIIPSRDEEKPNIARLKIALTVPADVEPVYRGNSLILAFDNPDYEETAFEETAAAPGTIYTEEEKAAEEKTPAAQGVVAGQTSPPKKYTGEKISIDFQDAELVHVFRLIADISGYNIVVSPDVKGKFSMRLIDVPWDQALDVILRNYGLSKSVEGNIIRIAPTSVLAREEEEIAKAKESQEKSGDLVTKVYPINYADVNDIKNAIEKAKILTKRGFISVDERTTSVIIKDVEKKHQEYENLIKTLDVATPQVSIDARIVEVTTKFTQELGIQWGGLLRPTLQTRIAGTSLTVDNGFFSSEPLLVNLPATVAKGSGGSIGIGYISSGALRALDLQLSAMETAGKGRIVSNPRVITMDNQKARILQGKKIPYETVSDQGTTTAFVDAALELVVTPHITPEGTILMNIDAKKNEANFSQTSFNNVPTIDTNEISTQVLVRNGDTLALGGIFKTTSSKDVSSVPLLGNVPYLEWLFKNRKTVDDTTELIIFITPRIIK